MSLSPPQQELLATETWAWLGAVVDTWYARPLSAADGCTEGQLDEVAARLGTPPPGSLAEWYSLVGNRLEAVQDHAVSPQDLTAAGRPLTVWRENQGVWSIVTNDEGVCASSDGEFPFGPMPLPAAVRGLLMSDTLVGAWSATGRGPLGELAETVRAGIADDITEAELAAIRVEFPELRVARNPFFHGDPLCGDATTFLRGSLDSVCGLEWMTASAESVARVERVLPFDPPGGGYVVELSFQGLTTEQRDGLLRPSGTPDVEWVRRVAGTSGHVGVATTLGTAAGGGVAYRITTHDAESLVSALHGSVPSELAETMTVAVRPSRISTFRVVWPEGGRGRGGVYRSLF